MYLMAFWKACLKKCKSWGDIPPPTPLAFPPSGFTVKSNSWRTQPNITVYAFIRFVLFFNSRFVVIFWSVWGSSFYGGRGSFLHCQPMEAGVLHLFVLELVPWCVPLFSEEGWFSLPNRSPGKTVTSAHRYSCIWCFYYCLCSRPINFMAALFWRRSSSGCNVHFAWASGCWSVCSAQGIR